MELTWTNISFISIKNVTVAFMHFEKNFIKPLCYDLIVHSSCLTNHFPTRKVVTELKSVNPSSSAHEVFTF
jgi:hypothetical protein